MSGFTDLSAWSNVLSTALNALTTATATSSTITPPTGPRPFYIDLRATFASFTPASGQGVNIYIQHAVDDTPTNFADVTSLSFRAFIPFTSGASPKYGFVERIACPIVPFRIAVTNSVTGTALAASGNTIDIRTYSEG